MTEVALFAYTALLECPACELTFEAEWQEELLDQQQLDEPPVSDFTCPGCGHCMPSVSYPGWTFFGEAG